MQISLMNDSRDSMPSGMISKLSAIVEAVKVVKNLTDQPIGSQQIKVLNKFSGFGPVANIAFKGEHPLSQELLGLLTEEELRSAKRSTPNAFYTSNIVMRFMYNALMQLGVGKHKPIYALEPGAGIGRFIGIAPDTYSFTAVEREIISAQVAKALYPDHRVLAQDFKNVSIQDKFDVVIGNVPFGSVDMSYHGKSLRVHDYFILKSLDMLRDGGIMAVVTSAFTMDKKDTTIS